MYVKAERDMHAVPWISPCESALAALDRPQAESFPDAPFIWPFGCTRFHAVRLFTPQKPVRRAELAMRCDNRMDIWLNGQPVATDAAEVPLRDVTAAVRDGENQLHIRGFQSRTFDTFTAAMTGGLRLIYADGTTEEFCTDESFRQVQLVNFWATEEPDGFETEAHGLRTTEMNVMTHHPFALRRSFYLIRSFTLAALPVTATLTATALGCYEPYLNGARISDDYFEPFCMNFRKECREYDVRALLRPGENTMGALMGNGTYNCRSWGTLRANVPEYAAVLTLTYADGTVARIATDENWRCVPSPIVENDIQYGERYDARLETPDWCGGRLDPARTAPVHVRPNTDAPQMLLKSYPPVRRMATHRLREWKRLPDGSPMYDVGECIAGRAAVTFRGLRRGQQVRIRYCERLTDAGLPENGAYVTVFYPNDCAPDGPSAGFLRNVDGYTAAGRDVEHYACRFAYTGFRYIWIEGLGTAQSAEVTAFELYNDLPQAGEIETDTPELRRIFAAARRSWRNNLANGPTDCPTREKNYWNGDSQLFAHTACWLTDNSDFLARWTDNGVKMHAGPYAWEDETYEIPYTLYRFYGDTEILRARYPEMQRLIEKRQEYPGMILPVNGISHQYNDWLAPSGVSPNTEFFGGCWYIHMLDRVAEIAGVLGHTDDRAKYAQMAGTARDAFNRAHLTDDGRDYDARCQCGIVLPLAFGIAPEPHRQALADTLAAYVHAADDHVTTGFIGVRYLPEVLVDYGYAALAMRILRNPTPPSWLAMLNTGATAITESWNGAADPDKSLSMAHFSLGSVAGWFFEYLGGLRVNDSAPGLRHVVLRPVMLPELGRFGVRYRHALGTFRTEWHFADGRPVFAYAVPDGVTAEVIVPDGTQVCVLKNEDEKRERMIYR